VTNLRKKMMMRNPTSAVSHPAVSHLGRVEGARLPRLGRQRVRSSRTLAISGVDSKGAMRQRRGREPSPPHPNQVGWGSVDAKGWASVLGIRSRRSGAVAA
jgi:hypothetical protein